MMVMNFRNLIQDVFREDLIVLHSHVVDLQSYIDLVIRVEQS